MLLKYRICVYRPILILYNFSFIVKMMKIVNIYCRYNIHSRFKQYLYYDKLT